MRSTPLSLSIHRCIVRIQNSTLLTILLDYSFEVMALFIQDVVQDHDPSFATNHTKYPLKLVTVTRLLVDLSSKLRLVKFSCMNKLKVRTHFLLIIVCHHVVN